MAGCPPVRLSDLLGDRAFRGTRTCQDLYAPRDVRRQIVIPTMTDGHGTAASAWSLNRGGRDFDKDELRVVVMLQPLLSALEGSSAWRPAPEDARELGVWAPWARRAEQAVPTSASGTEPDEPAGERVGFTPRERQVADLLAEGCTARSVALRLRISERTVRKHLENVYAKSGCHDRLQLVLWVRQGDGPAR